MKKRIKGFAKSFCCVFLLAFMIMIFGPAEVYFTNSVEFKFIYSEFAYWMIAVGIVISIIVSLIISLFPKTIQKVLLSIMLGISIAGYIQVMFINKDLDLLGVNPEGYSIGKNALFSIFIWSIILIVMLVLAFYKEKTWDKLIVYISVCLLLIQGAAYVSLIVGADDSCYEHEAEGTWYLSGEKQYTVSGQDNIIVIILDYLCNQYIEPTLAQYPDLLDGLNDFTYYDNMDCVYFGTFPSIPAMLSGQKVEPTMPINEWFRYIWSNDKTKSFYQKLREKNYESYVYTTDTTILCGTNDIDILCDDFTNLSNAGQDLVVNYKKLRKTMFKLSSFRLLPDYFKGYAYVDINEYEDIVQPRENSINHYNYVFYNKILSERLKKDEGDKNFFIYQHLMGPHAYDTGADGQQKSDASMEETVKGCMVIMNEYLNQLKALGVYDNSTIIITADHGSGRESQVAYFIKEKNEKHDKIQNSNVPASLADLLATVGKAAGIDYNEYGKAVSDYDENEKITRKVWVRDHNEDYPTILRFTYDTYGNENVYYEYEYTGDINELLKKYDEGPTNIIPMLESFY